MGLTALLLPCLSRSKNQKVTNDNVAATSDADIIDIRYSQKKENILRIYQKPYYVDQESYISLISDDESDSLAYTQCQAQQNILRQPMPTELAILPGRLEIQTTTVLGMGSFGVVFKGLLDGGKPVAVKTVLHLTAHRPTRLLLEVKIMSYIGNHPNIVQLLGFQMGDLHEEVVHAVIEYCSRGSLKDVLHERRNELNLRAKEADTAGNYSWLIATNASLVHQLLPYCEDVCSAMEFLNVKRIIHGDLAARNVMVDGNGVAKISDFGMSRETHDKYVVAPKGTCLPWRSLAIETLQDLKFSSHSDVWAYGVLMWEVFSLGRLPYTSEISFSQDFVTDLVGGFRLQIPEFATPEIYELMQRCWCNEPMDRITFQQLSTELILLRGLGFGTPSKAMVADKEYYIQAK